MRPNAHWERSDAADKVGVEALWWSHDRDVEIAGEDFLPEDSQLEIREPVTDATVDAGAVGRCWRGLARSPSSVSTFQPSLRLVFLGYVERMANCAKLVLRGLFPAKRALRIGGAIRSSSRGRQPALHITQAGIPT
jgi:hypothetical protein